MRTHAEPAEAELPPVPSLDGAPRELLRLPACDDFPVVVATRMSLSFPVLLSAIPLWTVDFRRKQWVKCWFSDGGITSNFPIHFFDSPIPRWPTFGIKLSAEPDAAQGQPNRITGPISMLKAMVDTATGFYDRMHVASDDAVDRTIFIDTGSISSIDFGLTDAQRDQLFASGRRAALEFLDGRPDEPGRPGRPAWDFDAYIARHRSGTAAVPGPRSAASEAGAEQ
jgi:NTE family protein